MRKLFSIILLVFCASHTHSQLIVRSISLKGSGEFSFRFPYVVGPDSAISGKINLFLQQEILGNAKIEASADPLFRNARYIDTDTIDQPGYTSLEYTILNNTKVFSLQFKGETMAAYPDYYNDYYSFDSKTGELVRAKDILTGTGLQGVLQLLLQKRQRYIAQFIKENYTDAEDSAYIKEQYANCINETEPPRVCIQNKSVLFHIGPCFPHAVRGYDTDLDITIPAQQLNKYLSEYGKMILFEVEK